MKHLSTQIIEAMEAAGLKIMLFCNATPFSNQVAFIPAGLLVKLNPRILF